jgi:hypothetical protein
LLFFIPSLKIFSGLLAVLESLFYKSNFFLWVIGEFPEDEEGSFNTLLDARARELRFEAV